jgi:Raf kinase inhibitor-like YbhB/YbcL family protein
VLIVDDPDAPVGTWVHWLAWNMPITSTEIYEGTKSNDRGLTQGLNDFHQVGWGGPCPPKNNGAHRYVFRMYALDTILPLESGASRAMLEAAMNGHILATGEWVGTYERRP